MAIVGNDRLKGLAKSYWKVTYPDCYGLLGYDGLTEGEKAHNRETSARLMDENTLPFLHEVKDVNFILNIELFIFIYFCSGKNYQTLRKSDIYSNGYVNRVQPTLHPCQPYCTSICRARKAHSFFCLYSYASKLIN